jgi:gelsolin
MQMKKLFRLKELDNGNMEFSLVATGKFKKEMLDSGDVFILDQVKTFICCKLFFFFKIFFSQGQEIFVWCGLKSSPKERKWGVQYAQSYLGQYDRPKTLPITRILEGLSLELFFVWS